MKKILSMITAMVMIFCLFPPVRSFAANTETVQYINYVSDGNGGYKAQTTIAACTVIDSANTISNLSSGWYAVKGNVTITGRIPISGTVNLILTDGSKLTAYDGIHLSDGNTLNIYGQSGGTGILNAESNFDTAIGGDSTESCGTLNVYGGQVNAKSGYGAAIGGGESIGTGGNGGTVNVYGGQVNAESTSVVAIGGGRSKEGTGGNGGTINVYGGQVNAKSHYVAAIGGGASTDGTGGSGSNLSVYGGEVIAKSHFFTAIGGGGSTNGTAGSSGQTFISGGSVSAYSEISNTPAFDHVPTFGAGYTPKVTYGKSNTSTKSDINPDNSVYTSNNYVSIEIPLFQNDYVYYVLNEKKPVQKSGIAACLPIDSSTTQLTDGWYAVSGNVTINNRITISGNVHLILTDDCILDAKEGINLSDGNTLNIYGQSNGTGILDAGSDYKTAIGGNPEESCGTLNVYGGKVKAESDYETAIGGGDPTNGTGGNGGNLNVYGGEVIAKSSGFTAIGGGGVTKGTPGSSGQTFISGGSVIAYSVSRNNAAFDHVPTFDAGYKPKVTYGESDTNTKSDINPVTDVYRSNKYVLIEKSNINDDHEHCTHSANTNPTCEGANCSVCGTYIAPTGHKNGDPVTENRTFTSCTEGGSYDEAVYCSVCGKEMSRETKTIEPSEHTAGKPVTENEAADGTYDEVVYCSVCNAEMSRERKVRAEHKHIEGMADVITMPTFTSAGLRVFRCTLCGELLRSEAIPPITMNFPTGTSSSGNASQIIYTEFPELRFNVEIKDGIAVISWDNIETADRYVIYAIKDGKISEIAKIKKTSFETKHQSGTDYLVRYMKNGVLSPRSKSMNENFTSDKPIVSASAGKDFIRLDWQDMGAEKYNIYKYVDGKAIKIGEVKKTAVKIKNLSPDTEYKFIVTAVIDGKETTMLMRDILTVRTKKA